MVELATIELKRSRAPEVTTIEQLLVGFNVEQPRILHLGPHSWDLEINLMQEGIKVEEAIALTPIQDVTADLKVEGLNRQADARRFRQSTWNRIENYRQAPAFKEFSARGVDVLWFHLTNSPTEDLFEILASTFQHLSIFNHAWKNQHPGFLAFSLPAVHDTSKIETQLKTLAENAKAEIVVQIIDVPGQLAVVCWLEQLPATTTTPALEIPFQQDPQKPPKPTCLESAGAPAPTKPATPPPQAPEEQPGESPKPGTPEHICSKIHRTFKRFQVDQLMALWPHDGNKHLWAEKITELVPTLYPETTHTWMARLVRGMIQSNRVPPCSRKQETAPPTPTTAAPTPPAPQQRITLNCRPPAIPQVRGPATLKEILGGGHVVTPNRKTRLHELVARIQSLTENRNQIQASIHHLQHTIEERLRELERTNNQMAAAQEEMNLLITGI